MDSRIRSTNSATPCELDKFIVIPSFLGPFAPDTFDAKANAHLAPTDATFSPPRAADVAIIRQFANLVLLNTFRSLLFILSIFASRSDSGNKSHLFSTIISLSVVISPITMHSAVCVWMPLFASITRIIISIICAPPIIVRISDA